MRIEVFIVMACNNEVNKHSTFEDIEPYVAQVFDNSEDAYDWA